MTDRQRQPNARRGRQTSVFGLLLMPLFFAGLFGLFQHQRYTRLNADIVNAGGKLKLPPPVWTIYWHRWHGRGIYDGTGVELTGKSLPPGFLRDRDFLRHVDITDLEIREVTANTTEFAELVAAHPVHHFVGYQINGADQVAEALQSGPHVFSIAIVESDLSDEGLKTLPLEDVSELRVRQTEVTSEGLLELQRCENLRMLSISGTQLDESSISVIGQLPKNVSLTVHDSVSADLLRRFKGSQVRSIFLYNTSLNTEEINQLKHDLPEIDVSTN